MCPTRSALRCPDASRGRLLTGLSSTYARGTDDGITYGLLDLTKLGRQDENYKYPVDFKLHDEYDQE